MNMDTTENLDKLSPGFDRSKISILTFTGYWISLGLLLSVRGPINAFIKQFVEFRSEYGVLEQMSKFYLLILILVAVLAYTFSEKIREKQISIGFFLLGAAMYLSESNMISEKAQPIFAFVFLAYIYYGLFRERSWLTIALVTIALFIISLGSMVDILEQFTFLQAFTPKGTVDFLYPFEEHFDMFGEGFLCITVILHFIDPVIEFTRENLRGVLFLIGSVVFVTIGNSFLHYQYDPGRVLEGFALVLSLIGCAGLILVNHFVLKSARLKLVTPELFYGFLFTLLVTLPAVYGTVNTIVSLLVWLPALTGLGFYMYKQIEETPILVP